jgi:hypothetical protein
LQAKRSNPEAAREELDCFVAALLAMTETVIAGLDPAIYPSSQDAFLD